MGTINVGKRPRDLAFTPDGSRAYVTSEIDGTVWVIDVPTRKAIKVIKLPKDSKPMGVVVSPDGKRVYVANGRGGTVSVIDAATNTVIHTIPVGQRPWGIALTPDGRKLYTANGPSNDVTVVDTEKHAGTQEDSGRKDSLGSGNRTGALAGSEDMSGARAPYRSAIAVGDSARRRRPPAGCPRVPFRGHAPDPSCTGCGTRACGAKAERVACLAGSIESDTVRISRAFSARARAPPIPSASRPARRSTPAALPAGAAPSTPTWRFAMGGSPTRCFPVPTAAS